MAANALYSPTNQKLYNELKQRFHEVPELVIETIMLQVSTTSLLFINLSLSREDT